MSSASLELMSLRFREMDARDPAAISDAFAEIGWNKPEIQYRRYLAEQTAGDRAVIVAEWDGYFAAYLTVQFTSGYEHFRTTRIPEIKDLNVLPRFRRQGIATALINEAERMCVSSFRQIGVGFGLTPAYGAAQILYVSLGYVPDGHGVSYQGECQEHGTKVTLDDDLVLYLVKSLPG